MTVKEQLKKYVEEEDDFIFASFLLSWFVAFSSLYFAFKMPYFSVDEQGDFVNGFSVFVLILFIMALAIMTIRPSFFVHTVFTKLDFKKEEYASDDFSMEFLLGKVAFGFFSFVGLFITVNTVKVDDVGLFVTTLFVSLLMGVIGASMVACFAAYYFGKSQKTPKTWVHKEDSTHWMKHTFFVEEELRPTQQFERDVKCILLNKRLLSSTFANEGSSLQVLLLAFNEKCVDDVEVVHTVSSNVQRLEKAITLYDTLSVTNQEKTKSMILNMFADIHANIQQTLDAVDERTMLEIQKQQELLKK